MRAALRTNAVRARLGHGTRAVSSMGQDLRLSIGGMQLAGVEVGHRSSHRKVLFAHGWMDCATTHQHTVSAFADQGFHCVSLDLPGHGKSDRRGLADAYSAGGYALAVMEAAEALGWSSFALCSHSMGAGVSSMAAGALGSKVTALVVLEGIGMNTKAEPQTGAGLKACHEARSAMLQKLQGPSRQKVYATKKDAAMARVSTVKRYPGNQSISYHGALALVERATEEVVDPTTGAVVGYRFIHDPRLMEPSPTYVTEPQMLDYLRRVSAPSLCVTGTTGWPWPSGLMLGRICAVPDIEHHHIVGGHHLHLDDETAPTVNAIIRDFVRRRLPDMDARAQAADDKQQQSKHHHHTHDGKVGSAAVVAAEFKQAPKTGFHPLPLHPTEAPTIDPPQHRFNTVGKHNPTAPTEAGDADSDDAVRAAQNIAAATVTGLDAAAAGAAAVDNSAVARRRRRAEAGEQPLWTDKHVFIAHPEPFDAQAATAMPASFVHMHDNVLVVDRASADTSPPLYRWMAGGRMAGSIKTAAPPTASERVQLAWLDVPDHVAGLAAASLLRRHGGASAQALRFGMYAPRIFLDTMPTLEAVTMPESDDSAPDASKADAGRQLLEAKGSAY